MTSEMLNYISKETGGKSMLVCLVGSRAYGYELLDSDTDYAVYIPGTSRLTGRKIGNTDLWFFPMTELPCLGQGEYQHLPDMARIKYCSSQALKKYIEENRDAILLADMPGVYRSLLAAADEAAGTGELRYRKSVAESVVRGAYVLDQYFRTGKLRFALSTECVAVIRAIKRGVIAPEDVEKYMYGVTDEKLRSFFYAKGTDYETLIKFKFALIHANKDREGEIVLSDYEIAMAKYLVAFATGEGLDDARAALKEYEPSAAQAVAVLQMMIRAVFNDTLPTAAEAEEKIATLATELDALGFKTVCPVELLLNALRLNIKIAENSPIDADDCTTLITSIYKGLVAALTASGGMRKAIAGVCIKAMMDIGTLTKNTLVSTALLKMLDIDSDGVDFAFPFN